MSLPGPSYPARARRLAALERLLAERILVLDGAMGTMIQAHNLAEGDFRGDRFRDHPSDLRGCNDLLSLTQPGIIAGIHREYLAAGADLIETNSFNSTPSPWPTTPWRPIARNSTAPPPRWPARPPTRLRRPSPGIPIRGRRHRTDQPDRVAESRRQRSGPAQHRLRHPCGGVRGGDRGPGRGGRRPPAGRDDLRHPQRQGRASSPSRRASSGWGARLPVMISGTIVDQSGRTLSGQTVEAFWLAVAHARPIAVGLNCALGARALRPHLQELARVAPVRRERLPQRGPPQRVRRVRRVAGPAGGGHRRVRAAGAGEHRRRLLRDHAGAHPRHRRRGTRTGAAPSAGGRAAAPAERARAAHRRARPPTS